MSQVESPQPQVRRAIVYVDGFNFYYGALKNGPHKWLNLERFFCRLRQHDQIQRIRYFTAKISGYRSANQEAYLLALTTLPLVDVILGRFKAKQFQCMVPACPNPGRRVFTTQEEKRTDVNIALWMLQDAQQDLCDRLILVSGDSDLVPAVRMVKDHFPGKEIVAYIPARNEIRGAALELRAEAHKNKTLPLDLLAKSQFAASIDLGGGRTLNKPATW
ncbi:MAG: NYN domain-containing protein [Thermoguttaceae bacterium]